MRTADGREVGDGRAGRLRARCSSTPPAPGSAPCAAGPRPGGAASRPTSPSSRPCSAPCWPRPSTPSPPAGSSPTPRAARTWPRRASSSATCSSDGDDVEVVDARPLFTDAAGRPLDGLGDGPVRAALAARARHGRDVLRPAAEGRLTVTAQDGLVWRAPTPADAEALGRMHHQAWVDAYSHLLPDDWFEHWTVDDAIARWRGILTAPHSGRPHPHRRLRRDRGGGRLGRGGPVAPGRRASRPARPRELWGLYVAREHHGSGLARALAERALGDEPAELLGLRRQPPGGGVLPQARVRARRRGGPPPRDRPPRHPDGARWLGCRACRSPRRSCRPTSPTSSASSRPSRAPTGRTSTSWTTTSCPTSRSGCRSSRPWSRCPRSRSTATS